MTVISKHEATAVVDVGSGITLDVIDARVTLDDGWTPYIQVELTCWTPDEDDLELLDPRDQLRVTLTLTKEVEAWNPGQLVDQERTFDLLLRGRTVDHTTGTMTVVLESDEALLQDLALVATEDERVFGLSVKTAVEYALDKVGAVLAAGAADASIDPDPNLPATVTNLITNPSGETNTTGWSSRATTGSFARSSAHSLFGTYSVSFKLTSTVGSAWANDYISLPAGTKVTFSYYIRSTIARTVRATLIYVDASNATVGFTDGDDVGISTTDWTRVTVTGTITGTGAVKVRPVVYIVSGTTTETYYVDGAMLTEGDTVEDYFDGASADTDFIDYAWTGTANGSTSTKAAKPNSSMMIWEPGTTAWDYLEPLLQAAALRLYCDETRSWILEPSGTTRDGQINVATGLNVTEASDQISRAEEWYDSVVIAYTRALDAEGNQVTVYDTAGAPGTKTLVLTFARPYPGPGAAQAFLDRAQGRGRVLKLESISDYTATPGMTLSATLPDSPIQTGTISRVVWMLPDDRMTIGSRGLTDTPDNAWLFAVGAWSAATGSWAAATGTN